MLRAEGPIHFLNPGTVSGTDEITTITKRNGYSVCPFKALCGSYGDMIIMSPYEPGYVCNLSSTGESHTSHQEPRGVARMASAHLDMKQTNRPSAGINSRSTFFGALGCLVAVACIVAGHGMAAAQTPVVGAKASDFTLQTPTGNTVALAKERAKGTTVLVVLRGFPGYQCPYCVKQVHDFVKHSADFAARKANVVLVYPGPPAELDQHAREFLAKQANLPSNIKLVTDPDYKMTNLYGLRWDAPNETAYPATFILDASGTILFEKISHSHGDRTSAGDILAQLKTN
jgi:thioredoxin-dependent peroxiredoxin